jgi:HAD superfamily hydrolase (TIGR01509 family)
VLFDVDGTLVDTNYLHAAAWWDAFRAFGRDVAMSQVHRLIGQGSERLVESVLGEPNDDIVGAHSDFFAPRLHDLRAFDGAAELLRKVKSDGLTVVLATSASGKDASFFRQALDADDVIDAVTTNDDAESSKPDPDIVETAMAKTDLRAEECLFVGDTVWDIEAARQAGLDCLCVLTGGISEAELRDAGAIAVYRDLRHLLEEYDGSPLADLVKRTT